MQNGCKLEMTKLKCILGNPNEAGGEQVDLEGVFLQAFKDISFGFCLDLERSQKVDLGTCRSQEPLCSLRLGGKPYDLPK